MDLCSLEVSVKDEFEEYISRICYEEIKSSIQIQYEDCLSKIIVYGQKKSLEGLQEKIKTYIKDFFNNQLEITFKMSHIEKQDWTEKWKDEFNCIEFGNKIVIKPYFKDYGGEISNIITINPSIGFGSGEHQTTKLMINKLIEMDLLNKKILDVGSGSGILSIISLKLNAKKVIMVEIDRDAGENSKENFSLNNMLNNFNLVVGDFSDVSIRNKIAKIYEDKFDIVLMNILPGTILNLTEYINSFLKVDGLLIISGIISERYEEIKSCLEKNNYSIVGVDWLDNWARIDCINS